MYLLRSVAAALVSSCLFSTSHAHSTQRNPLNYFSKVENARFNTPSQRIHALSKFDLTFDLHDGEQRIRLTLAPNHDVIQNGATIQHLAPDGTIRTEELIDRSQYRVFKGQAWLQHFAGAEWTNVGWARIMVQQDGAEPLFEGAFRVDGDHHHIQTRTHYMQTRHAHDPKPEDTGKDYMVIWRDSDISADSYLDFDGHAHGELKRGFEMDGSCSANMLGFNTQSDHPVYTGLVRRDEDSFGAKFSRRLSGRQIDGQTAGNSAGVNLVTTIGNPAGCPDTRKVALVGVATDCTYTADFNSTSSARANIISVMNMASVQYEDSFNITLGIQNLTLSDAVCPGTAPSTAPWNVACSDSVTIQDRLNLFSAWRGERADTNAYWMLLSKCGTGSAVGLAWLGQACVATSQVASSSSGNETVSGANVVARTSNEWQVIAHETGHIFGAVHDCDSETCNDGTSVASQQCCPLSSSVCDAGGAYIMNPSTGANIQKFSPCTIGNICNAIGRNSVKTSCLTANKDITTISGSQCGNGIVESGEDCDCGGTGGCASNACCEPATCKFKGSAVCDPSNEDCCTGSCQFASNGTTLMGSYTQNNDTYACDSSDCQISCASPEFGTNVCYSMQQNFLDGTSCGGGGKCNNGLCKGSTLGKEITSWISRNKTLVIALASTFGGLILLSTLSCCVSRYRRRQGLRAQPAAPPPGWVGVPQWNMAGASQITSRGHDGTEGSWENGRWKPPTDSPPAWQPSVRYG
ncbi:ADAM 8 precursor [Diplocarpon rosae]|nr:ADAM 8 precursor [Diplocarpon rosae]